MAGEHLFILSNEILELIEKRFLSLSKAVTRLNFDKEAIEATDLVMKPKVT